MQSRRFLSSKKRPSFPDELSKTGDHKGFRTLRTGETVEVYGERRHQEPARCAPHSRRFDAKLFSYPLEKGKSRRRRLSRSVRRGSPPVSGRHAPLSGV